MQCFLINKPFFLPRWPLLQGTQWSFSCKQTLVMFTHQNTLFFLFFLAVPNVCDASPSLKNISIADFFFYPALFTSMFTILQSSSSLPLLEHFCISWYVKATRRSVVWVETIGRVCTTQHACMHTCMCVLM